MIYIFIAFITGAFVITSMVTNSRLGEEIGIFQSTLINYIVGLIGTLILLAVKDGQLYIPANNLYSVPWWSYLGGAIGVLIVATSNVVIPKIPAIYSTLLIFIGQIGTGIIIDYTASNLISKGKIFGSILILAGLLYNFYIDKKKTQ
ncbi:DMT family transporter [Clostridium rectalis]|uniref:DMT family transporter n=1 Tax=Clostridium rectalis TaxID=2040295 RepID=UPI000F62D3C7|nr:DMT family transporter [Clostridium rectalis]